MPIFYRLEKCLGGGVVCQQIFGLEKKCWGPPPTFAKCLGGMPTNFLSGLEKMLGGGGGMSKYFRDLKKMFGGGILPKYFMDLKKCLGGMPTNFVYELEKCWGGGGVPKIF